MHYDMLVPADKPPAQSRLSLPQPPAREVEGVLEGEVLHVTYENPETGFRVLRVAVAGKSLPQTVVGVLPAAPPGTRIRATGELIDDRRHGKQFKAATLLTLAPATLKGIQRYLGSGLVPGIGQAFAKRIVKVFGDKTIEVLDRQPERLHEVPGLGKARVQAVTQAWAKHRDINAIMVFLQAHGASPSLATRIYKRFGAKAMSVVSRSPYRLALDVWGIGFKTADSIARSVGVDVDAPERAQAGVLHILHELAGSGHIFGEFEDVVERATKMLECNSELVREAIVALESANRVKTELLSSAEGDRLAVYQPALYTSEVQVAGLLTDLLRDINPLAHAAAAMDSFEKVSGLSLAPAQRAAIAEVAAHKVVVITGGPGVGKTTIVRAVLALFDSAHNRAVLAAPTGRAAKRMSEATGREASTIHRLLAYDPRTGSFQHNADKPLEVDALIVDESSMMDIALCDGLLQAVPAHARLVLVGDVDQLPSVGPGSVLGDIIRSGVVPTVRLTEIFRQAEGSSIVENAHLIHAGRVPVGGKNKGEQFYVIERQDGRVAADLIEHLVSKRIPDSFGIGRADIQVLTPMRRGPSGTIALNERLQNAVNPPSGDRSNEVKRGSRILRVRDKVMQLRNNYDKDTFNGDIGYVATVDAQARKLSVVFETKQVEYNENELDELALAYATTIHKSQGSEYRCVVVPMLTDHYVMLSRNLLYTAVTRGKELVIVITSSRAMSIALGETRRESRNTFLAQRIAAARGS